MKKNLVYLLSFLSVATVASCTKELVEPEEVASSSKKTTLTITLDPSTRTSLSEGKTYWTTGDKILVTDGTQKDTVVIPTADNGSSTATVTTSLSASKLYAVYPMSAFKSVTDGKININIPTDQSGIFSDANISAAVSSNQQLLMKNATAVMKITTSDDALYVVLNAVGTTISGAMAVEFAEDGSIASTTPSGSTGVITMEAPTADDYYVAVAPGTYSAGFSVMAINPADGKFESKESKTANTIPVNGMVDLGSIGDNLSGFDGSGTEADPYRISSLGEMIAFANCVNAGKDFAGEYVKLMNNVSGLTTTIGCYDTAAKADRYFNGDFNGNNKTVTVNLNGANCKSPNYVALFGEAGAGSHIHDLTVAGTVTTTGYCSAGVVGCINAGAGAKMTNVTNKANVSGLYEIGGIVGYVDATAQGNMVMENCTNNGTVTAKSNYDGGIAGYAKCVDFINCTNNGNVSGTNNVGGIVGYGSTLLRFTRPKNTGSITGTKGCAQSLYHLVDGYWRYSALDGSEAVTSATNMLVGVAGICGYANNSTFTDAENSGTIKGVDKVAGIIGALYGGTVKGCTNSGTITASGNIAAGIQAYQYVQSTVLNCTNNGKVTANAVAGGIMGLCNALGYSSSATQSYIQNCKNTKEIKATGTSTIYIRDGKYSGYSAAGGIVGIMADGSQSNVRLGKMNMTKCTNEGPVTGAGMAVGGIIGLMEHWYTNATSLMVNACTNSAKITGERRVGGIVGATFHRYLYSSAISIRNAVNSGDVYATTNSDGTSCAGGIVGWSWNTSSSAAGTGCGIRVYNAENTGNVYYSNAAFENPYCGGIVGYSIVGILQNSYNAGKVGPVSGTPVAVADSTVGASVGFMDKFMSAEWNYYLTGTANQAYGKRVKETYTYTVDGTEKVATILGDYAASTDDGITLNSAVTCYGATDETDLVTVLKAWVTKNESLGYFTWQDGPSMKIE